MKCLKVHPTQEDKGFTAKNKNKKEDNGSTWHNIKVQLYKFTDRATRSAKMDLPKIRKPNSPITTQNSHLA